MAERVVRSPFVGRERELAMLLERLDAARQGTGGVVLVAGEPGIGKTRLLAELAARARAAGWVVLSGRAYESEGMPPYLPFTEALRDYVRACPTELLQTQLGNGGAEVVLVAPDVARRLPGLPPSPPLSPESERYRLFESVTDFLLAIAGVASPPGPLSSFAGEGEDGDGAGEDGDGAVAAGRDRDTEAGKGQQRDGGVGGPLLRSSSLAAAVKTLDSPPPPAMEDTSATSPLAATVPAHDSSPLSTGRGEGPGVRPPAGLLLLLDDLHWADTPSLLLFQHLARRLEGAPLLVAGAYRTTDLARTHPLAGLLAEWRRERQVERLSLATLSSGDTTALLDALSGIAVSPPLAEAVYRETEGNPFFVEEVVRHLQAEAQDLTKLDPMGPWRVPEGVREVIGRRLSRLSEAANQALQVAAVLGDGFGFEVLGAASSINEATLEAVVEEMVEAGILREDASGYGFGHALIRQTVYEELSLPRRQRLHLRAAEAIEAVHARNLTPRLSALATHYRLASAAADSEKTIHYAVRAGEQAQAVFAWEEAASHWRAALELLDERGQDDAAQDSERCDLLLALGDALRMVGDYPAAKAIFGRAAELARKGQAAEQLGRAVLGFAELPALGVDAAQITLLEDAIRAQGEDDSALKARLMGLLAENLHILDGSERCFALSQEAVALARHLGEPATLAYALNERAWALEGSASLEEPLAIATEMRRLAEKAGDTELTIKGYRWQVVDLVELGDLPAADAAIAAHAQLAAELGNESAQYQALTWQAMRALVEGRFDDAERQLQDWESYRRQRQLPTGGPAIQALCNLRREQGWLGEMEVTIRSLAERNPSTPLWPSLLAWLYSELGREPEARETFERLVAEGLPLRWRRAFALPYYLAQACAFLGDTTHAALIYERLQPHAERNGTGNLAHVCFGAVAHYLGLLAATMGRYDLAAEHYEQAIAMNARMGARPYLAHSQHEYAAMLLKRRQRTDRPRAQELLEQALSTYTDLGMDFWSTKAQALLDSAGGARPALSPQSSVLSPRYPDDLSEREVEVLRLIATGKSNQAIADELVISLNTVARHVNHILTKVGAANRTEAAAYAHQKGLT